MWNKKGMNHIDWAVSISLFVLYMAWFFLLIKPYYFVSEDPVLLKELDESISDQLAWSINKTPLIVFSDIEKINQPLELEVDIDKIHSAFADNRYFSYYQGNIYFLADVKEGKNLYTIVSSEEVYDEPEFLTDLIVTNYSTSNSNMKVNYHDGLPNKVYYDNELAIDNFDVFRLGSLVDVNVTTLYYSKLLSVNTADTVNDFYYSSYVYAENSKVNNRITLDMGVMTRIVDVSMEILGYTNYYSDNSFYGDLIHSGCVEYDSDQLYMYNDENLVGFIFDNETEISLCYIADGQIMLNLSFFVEEEMDYEIYFEPLAVILNGEFDDGLSYWSFVNNTNPYRTCTSKEGSVRLINDSSDPFLLGDWSGSSSGYPIAGFGRNNATLNGSMRESDGRLISSPFTIPDYAEFLHVWRHYDLNRFDNQSGLPDGVYLELRDPETDGLLLTLEKWESPAIAQNYDVEGDLVVNITSLHGQEAYLALNLVSNLNADSSQCQDGVEDALVQIDDVYFSNELGDKVDNSFDYDSVVSRVQFGGFDYEQGVPEIVEGYSEELIDGFNNMSYYNQKNLLGIRFDKEFRIIIEER